MSVEDRRRDDESCSDDVMPANAKDLDTKSASKVVRVLTVLAYLLSVSFAAILLSVYYIFIWDPPPPKTHEPAAQPLRDNSSVLDRLEPVMMGINMTVPTGDPAVTDTIATVSAPLYTPSNEPSDNRTSHSQQQRHLNHVDLLENQTNSVSKTNSNRIRGRDPEHA